jgi:hypothetical protein
VVLSSAQDGLRSAGYSSPVAPTRIDVWERYFRLLEPGVTFPSDASFDPAGPATTRSRDRRYQANVRETAMRIDQNANIEAFTKLADKTGEVQSQLGIGILKETMQNAEAATMQLLQSMQPHLGQNVDVRL